MLESLIGTKCESCQERFGLEIIGIFNKLSWFCSEQCLEYFVKLSDAYTEYEESKGKEPESITKKKMQIMVAIDDEFNQFLRNRKIIRNSGV